MADAFFPDPLKLPMVPMPAFDAPRSPLIDVAAYRGAAAKLIGSALADNMAWDKLAFLGDQFGHRLNGSPGQQMAIDWSIEQMKREGLENVRAEEAMVPKWVRGSEGCMLLGPIERPLEMASYGNSVGTPPEGITAEAIVVSCIEELEQRGTEIRDRIVILNPRWTPLLFDESWENYLLLREFRISGHRRAAQLGARAILLRSVYRQYARQAHTGALTYADDAPKIPSAALAPEDAMMLDRLHRRGDKLVLRLKMEARSDGEVKSANVIGELIGRERPEEVVVLGCQFDTWDLGSGALDDGAGAVMVWEPLRLMLAAGLRPRRTVRVMLCTNEENGASGAIAYRDRHADELHNHVAMLESDSGVFPPLQFRVSGVDATIAAVRAIYPLVANLGLGPVATPVKIGTAEDIYPSVEAGDIPALTLQGNNEPYSPFHHAKGDVVDNVPPADLARGTAAIAVMSYVLAEMPERLPRGKGLGARGAMHSQ